MGKPFILFWRLDSAKWENLHPGLEIRLSKAGKAIALIEVLIEVEKQGALNLSMKRVPFSKTPIFGHF